MCSSSLMNTIYIDTFDLLFKDRLLIGNIDLRIRSRTLNSSLFLSYGFKEFNYKDVSLQ